MIANLRLRLPEIQFSGISLNCENFVERHGSSAFPLCATNKPFYGMSYGRVTDQPWEQEASVPQSDQNDSYLSSVKTALKRLPVLGSCLKAIRSWGRGFWRESRHLVEGYRFLRAQDSLVVSGGGQLDEEWGGPWGHPFALFKWAVLARIAGIPYVIVSVGACKVASTTSRFFLSTALRMAEYRSYRDENSRAIAAELLHRAERDSVVPDLALSLPCSELPPSSGIRSIAQGRTVVAISPIVYAKPQNWPHEDPALYDRYVREMARAMSELLERGYFLVMVWSTLGDKRVVPDLLENLGKESSERLAKQTHIPRIETWRDLVAVLEDVDFLIASRLHSVILGLLTKRPTIAVSFDPKVDLVMKDFGQTDYLLQLRNFAAREVIEAFDRIELRRNLFVEQVGSYQDRFASACALQYDKLAAFASSHHHHN